MNTNAKHSPGPWRIGDAGNTVFGPPAGLPPVRIADLARTQNRIANARLIASAPALLEALKSAVSYLEANRPKGNIREIFHQLNEYENGVLKPARAAIAQAEGGAQ